jgi:chemotaxis protein CheY-P-specific phosphatase CheC
MNQQKRINKIIEAVEARIQDEVGSLLGADFTLVSGDRKLVSKEDAFDSCQGKQICAQMDITGEITGKGCLLIGVKDAIRLGGTLIMLPSGELEEVISREEYSEEIEDSYGEIANIIAGSFTKDFEEMYPKSFRFVRKEQEIVVPAKVDIESGDPIENQLYYLVSSSMVLDGRPMGDMAMLMPAASFGLQEQEKADAGNKTPDKPATPNKPTAVAKEKSPDEKGGSDTDFEVEETASNAHAPDPIKKPPVRPKFDPVKHEKKVNNLLAECGKKMEAEVGALLGVEIIMGDPENQLLSKEEFFEDHVTGRQIMATMEVVGDEQDKSYLVISIKDAIHLGGILIMLPPAELESVINANEFGEDSRDAYGEIANIVSGVYTSVFEEQYSRKLRFIRKELQEVVPANVDAASDEPIPDVNYYSSSISMAIGGKPLGEMHMLFPAGMLRLDVPRKEAEPDAPKGRNEDQNDPPVEKVSSEKEQGTSPQAVSPAGPAKTLPPSAQVDIKRHKKRVDKVLATCSGRMADEISALLGTDVKMTHLENMLVSKEEFFFDEVSGKQIIANMDVVGELEGNSYLSVGLRDAIRVGGSLIMLPAAELESVVAEEDLTEDIQDAYGEIANIIAGVYTAGFEEQYPKKIRFVKNGLQQVLPMKVDIDADEPIPNQDYYLSRMNLVLGELELGKVNILFPADLLELGGLRSVDAAEGESEEGFSAGQIFDDQEKTATEDTGKSGRNKLRSPDILVVGDDEAEAVKIADVLEKSGFLVKVLSFKDNLHNYMPGNLKAVYLVMRVVNEQAFGVAIKVSSACSVPVIAAGPGWTRTKVIKAVKYGVQDILLTPASHEDIEENVNNNLFELAA